MHFTLSDLVTDITQNSFESGAALVELEVRETDREFRFEVRDNGKGMSREELDRAMDPFGTDGEKHPGRKVGLGIPFLMQTASQSGGGWDVKSEKDKGTTVSAWFDIANVDTPPIGDLPGLFRTVFLFPGPKEVVVRRFLDRDNKKNNYEVRKSELMDALGDLEDGSSLALLDRYLRSIETEE
ncbi:MAG: ATP-binding protein [Spirochaetaceae bacterium]|jgi:hypothetical protein|nr:ATP-binding protein [Spirochaetaceae bacterium]